MAKAQWLGGVSALAIMGGMGLWSMSHPVAAVVVKKPTPVFSKVPKPPVEDPLRSDAGVVVVHVAGRVERPGLQTLPMGSRVNDALLAAGGPSAGCDLDAVNLAEPLRDGEKIVFPAKGAPAPRRSVRRVSRPYVASPLGEIQPMPLVRDDGPVVVAKPVVEHPIVALNSADAAELDTLPGVGPGTAAKILEYRRTHGAFSSIEEITAVPGIGPKKLEKMRPFLKL